MAGESVFPNYERCMALPVGTKEIQPIGGMSLRDYIAAKAMQALLSNDRVFLSLKTDEAIDLLAVDSFRVADAIVKERDK